MITATDFQQIIRQIEEIHAPFLEITIPPPGYEEPTYQITIPRSVHFFRTRVWDAMVNSMQITVRVYRTNRPELYNSDFHFTDLNNVHDAFVLQDIDMTAHAFMVIRDSVSPQIQFFFRNEFGEDVWQNPVLSRPVILPK